MAVRAGGKGRRIEGFLVLHFATPQPSRNRLRRSEPTPGRCDRCEKFFWRVTGPGAGEHDDGAAAPVDEARRVLAEPERLGWRSLV
jgi:hypothetical protein